MSLGPNSNNVVSFGVYDWFEVKNIVPETLYNSEGNPTLNNVNIHNIELNHNLAKTEDQLKKGNYTYDYSTESYIKHSIIPYNRVYLRCHWNMFFPQAYILREYGKYMQNTANFHSFSIKPQFLVNNYLEREPIVTCLKFMQDVPEASEQWCKDLTNGLAETYFPITENLWKAPEGNNLGGDVDLKLWHEIEGAKVELAYIECKSSTGDGWASLIGQGKRYASFSTQTMQDGQSAPSFVIVVRGTYISFFINSPCWHASYDLKNHKISGLLGLDVYDGGVYIIPQMNTPWAQGKVFNLANSSHVFPIHTILNWIRFQHTAPLVKPDLSMEDFYPNEKIGRSAQLLARGQPTNNISIDFNRDSPYFLRVSPHTSNLGLGGGGRFFKVEKYQFPYPKEPMGSHPIRTANTLGIREKLFINIEGKFIKTEN